MKADAGALVIRRDDAALVVATCRPIDFDHVSMEQRNLRAGLPWNNFWVSDEPRSLEAGAAISSDEPGRLEIPRLEQGDQIRIRADQTAPEGAKPIASSVFFIGYERLAEDEWLHADGSLTDSPCR